MSKVIRTLENVYLDGFDGIYKGYLNKDFYLRGYATYFNKEVIIEILANVKKAYSLEDYRVDWKYDGAMDCFIYNDLENGIQPEIFQGVDIMTEDGMKHLYLIEDWSWDIVDD